MIGIFRRCFPISRVVALLPPPVVFRDIFVSHPVDTFFSAPPVGCPVRTAPKGSLVQRTECAPGGGVRGRWRWWLRPVLVPFSWGVESGNENGDGEECSDGDRNQNVSEFAVSDGEATPSFNERRKNASSVPASNLNVGEARQRQRIRTHAFRVGKTRERDRSRVARVLQLLRKNDLVARNI